ncbi:MAG TPA: nuclear transport factor 2 family protein [Kofleriaceae bacterium]|nr:nuclear transport factor 2 family protein [Kofleriaceae bacterium]
MTLSAADRLAIHELISLHGHIADEGGPGQLDRLLTDDAQYDLEDFGMGVVQGLAALRRLWERSAVEHPLGHHVTNIVVSERPEGGAAVRSKGLAVMPDGRAGTVVYDDIVTMTPLGWRIARRKVISRRPAPSSPPTTE